jgi:diguanylate cyclase (GGDEF)-like protein
MPAPTTPQGPAQDDELIFVAESPASPGATAEVADGQPGGAWRVMIVDDDADVHSTTTFALGSLELHGRRLEFLHAYSAAEAKELLERHADIAVVLLDVIMEEADAGLHLVHHIRKTLGLQDMRIILRTGQPGYAPEMDAIRGYDINDYRTKSELTRTKLYTSVASAIRAYEQIRGLEASRRGLAEVVRANAELSALHSISGMANGILREAARLIGQPASGLICSCRGGEHAAGWEVVVAIGDCAELAPSGMLDAGGGAVADAIRRTLAGRSHLFGDGWLTLYFGGKSHCDFAAWLQLERPLDPLRRGLLELFASNIAVGLDNVALMTDLQRAAFYDPLTSLPNRTRLVELIDDGLTRNLDMADEVLCLIDIDHFSEINDALGHQFGDALLVAVAGRLRARLHARLQLARIGSDIFCVLGESGEVDPEAIRALFAAPFSIEGQDVQVGSTLGLVRLREHDGSGADALKDADIALKRAKSRQRGGHFYFSRSMGVEIRERVRLMHALRSGFARGELFLDYQPQVELGAHRPFGAEALLRWRTEDGRLVPPDRFIPIAETSGLIIDIGEWVLREACAELMRLRAAGYLDFTMSVNVSQVQFRHPGFLDMLRAALLDTGAPPERIELEITEWRRSSAPASRSRSTTSAPASPRCPTCSACRSTA